VTLLKSLLCQKGRDNRSRYAAINAISYISFTILSLTISNISFLLIILLLISVYLSGLSTLRRLNDASIKQKWFFAPSVSFLTIGLFIILTPLNIFYWLLIFFALFSLTLLTYPSTKKVIYTFGYNGPINISDNHSNETYQQRRANRVEPTIINNNILFSEIPSEESTTVPAQDNGSDLPVEEQDIGQLIRIFIVNNKNIFTVVITSIFVMTLIGIIYSQGKQEQLVDKEDSKKQELTTRLHIVNLPDNFSIMLSTFDGVIINWPADTTKESQIWSQLSAQGDSSCKNITFNNGDKFRTLSVLNDDNGEFYANFSPLDTKAILNSVAFRGKFTLCGYAFSLKGSQAILGKHKAYSEFIDY